MTAHVLRASDFGLPDNPDRPVQFALSRSFVDNLKRTSAIVSQAHASLGQPVTEAEIKRMMASVVLCLNNVRELSRWIYLRRVLPTEEAFRKSQDFQELGNEYVADMFSRLQKLAQGRPPERRDAYISAFEFMLQSRKNSLGRAVRKFCPCGHEKHDWKCSQRFKAGIHNLTKLLRKYAPDVAAQYSALHPDRAKK